MKTLLLTMCSPAYEELAAVTRPNHSAYAATRGYAAVCLDVADSPPYGDEAGKLRAVLAAFTEGADAVLLHDVDVAFTNHSLKLEQLHATAAVVVAREELRWWPMNFGVSLWRNTEEARALLHRLIVDADVWREYKWGVQTHLWNLMQTDAQVQRTVTLVPARVMNSTIQPGPSRWQLGDFACHFLDMPLADRIRLAREVLQIAGPCDGTYSK